MSRYVRIFNTTIGCKAVMAVSGLVLVLFLIGHLLGNLQIYAGQDKMNQYAAMLKGLGPLLWLVRIILLVVFLAHIFAGVRMHRLNVAARPEPYRCNAIAQADPLQQARVRAAIFMFYSGVAILLFVIYHLLHFTFGVVVYPSAYRSTDIDARPVAASEVPEAHHEVFEDSNGRYVNARSHGVFLDRKGRHDVYSMFVRGFQRPSITITYVVAMLFLGAHLIHGISSMFQTTGFNKPAYIGLLRVGGPILAGLIVLGNCLMPLTILLLNYPALPGKAG